MSARRKLTLGRDRFGICPLYWTRQGDWLLFASEIKGLLASGMVPARPDLRGIDHVFTFSALPAPTTCFEGVQLLRPGCYLHYRSGPGWIGAHRQGAGLLGNGLSGPGARGTGGDPRRLVDEFEDLLLKAVAKRLRADVPVGAYLSGGVDSECHCGAFVSSEGSCRQHLYRFASMLPNSTS